MTPDEAADLAARTLAVMEYANGCQNVGHRDYFRERVESDLAGLRRRHERHVEGTCGCEHTLDDCPDINDRVDGLRRTADLYGVKP